MCRSIKRLAKTPQDIRELWDRVLSNTQVRPIPTLSVDTAWDDIKASRRGEGRASTIIPKPTKRSKGNGHKKPLKKGTADSSSESAISWDSQDENQEVAPPSMPKLGIPPRSSTKRKPGRPRKRDNPPNVFGDITLQQGNVDLSDEDSLGDKVQFITTPRKRSRSDLHPFIGSGLVSSTDPMAFLHRRAFSSDTTPRSNASRRELPTPIKRVHEWPDDDRDSIKPLDQIQSLQSAREMQVEYHVTTLFSSMDALQQLGYCLQPSIHGRWFVPHICDWRMMPVERANEDPFLVASQKLASPDASQPPSSSGSLFSQDFPSPRPISTLMTGPPTEDVQSAAMDLCNLLASKTSTPFPSES